MTDKDYLRCIACVDDNIGRMLDYLDESGLAQNTIVIYSSDQGFYLGEHGWFDKRWMYEESLRTPFVIKWPGVTKPGTVNSNDISRRWILPRRFVRSPAWTCPKTCRAGAWFQFSKATRPKIGERFSIINTTNIQDLIQYYEPEVDQWEMFDLASDPNEMKSIYNSPRAAKDQVRMMAEMERLRAELEVTDVDPPASIRKPRKKAPKNNKKSSSQKKAG